MELRLAGNSSRTPGPSDTTGVGTSTGATACAIAGAAASPTGGAKGVGNSVGRGVNSGVGCGMGLAVGCGDGLRRVATAARQKKATTASS